MDSCTLWEAPINSCCTILKVVNNEEKIRLFDLGFSVGSEVIPLFKSSTGNTKLYLVKNTLIALRKKDSSLINAQYILINKEVSHE